MTPRKSSALEVTETARVPCRPFLKWVGGKGQLLHELLPRIPKFPGRYFEPFIGGGALFFALQPARAVLSDINPELINCYQVVQSKVDALIRDLKKHHYEREYFYTLREADRAKSFSRWSEVRRASRIIFLNKTCYNGLFRVNSLGQLNTPFGRYQNPTIVDEENLRGCSGALRGVKLLQRSFLEVESDARSGDFVYFDPPYVPLTATASFTGYSKGKFDQTMQQELYELCVRLDRKGVQFMLSNSSAPYVRTLYKRFRVELVRANRAINSRARGRGAISEVVVRNA
jgi:DNA adenine methylase